MDKLKLLAELEGFKSTIQMLEEFELEGAVPAICMNPGCEFTVYYEPDCEGGFCEHCRTNTVNSAFVIAGII